MCRPIYVAVMAAMLELFMHAFCSISKGPALHAAGSLQRRWHQHSARLPNINNIIILDVVVYPTLCVD